MVSLGWTGLSHPLQPRIFAVPPISVHPVEGGSAPPPRLLDRVCAEILARRYSLRTQDTYVDWIRRPFATHLLQAGYDTRTVQELFDCSGIQA